MRMIDSRIGQVRALTVDEVLGRQLNDIEKKYAPPALYVMGGMGIPIPAPRVAIVGTREPSRAGIETAHMLAECFAKKGVTVISGLAKGIDTAAHSGAIEAGGKTIAVLGTPLDRSYPSQNADLQHHISIYHLALSQFPLGHKVQRKDFILRNRTMALLCDASIIVEAGDSSGTLSQGWEALRLGRHLFVWHSVFENRRLKWPTEMANYGAIEFSDPDSVMDVLPFADVLPALLF